MKNVLELELDILSIDECLEIKGGDDFVITEDILMF